MIVINNKGGSWGLLYYYVYTVNLVYKQQVYATL